MVKREPIIGAILTGGLSSRMGKPKHAVRLPDGRTMIQAVAEALGSVDGCEQIVIVGSRAVCGGALPDAELIEDEREHAGPVGGIEALLASGAGALYLVIACDMPLVTGPVLAALVERAMEHDQPAMVVYASDERVHPLPCVLRAGGLSMARDLLNQGRSSMRALIDALAAARVLLGKEEADRLQSINTPEQLAALRATMD